MDLGSVLSRVSSGFAGKTAKSESYIAVKISSSSVVAVVWTVDSGKIILSRAGSARFTQANWENFLQSVDKAVSAALAAAVTEANKAIFAVPLDWVDGGKIKAEHLRDLRRLCKELDLLPSGFVVLTEALENYYKEIEGAPLTAVLVGIDGKDSVATMYRAGRNLGTVPLPLPEFSPEAVPAALEKSLKRFVGEEIFPSRIILYDGQGDLSAVSEKITAFPWTKQLPFLHFPKVEIAPAEMVAKAVAIAGGTQMGGTVGFSDEPSEALPNTEPVPAAPVPKPETVSDEELIEISAEEAGFTVDGDMAGETQDFAADKESLSGDDKNEWPKKLPSQKSPVGSIEEFPAAVSFAVSAPPPAAKNKAITSAILRNKVTKLFAGLPRALSRLRLPALPGAGPVTGENPISSGKNHPSKQVLFILTLAILVVLAALSAAFYFLPRATVILHIRSENFDQTLPVIITAADSPSVATDSASLPGQSVNITESDSKRGVATGKKLVGDPAKGSVTIYGVTAQKTFTAGTVITSGDGLKFTLDQSASVASGDAVTPATTTASVTAADIGDTYNLPAGTKFTLAGFSSSQYLAKNDTAFSGGNSHQATVVTADDQNRLVASLSAELQERARADLQTKIGANQKLLPNAVTATVSKKNFSAAVGAQAETVTLDMVEDFKAVVFSQSDLVSLFVSRFPLSFPAGYKLDDQRAQMQVLSAQEGKFGTTLSVELSGPLVPEINIAGQIAAISGKNQELARKALLSLPGAEKVTIDPQPAILAPVVNAILPLRHSNINFSVVSD